MSSHTLMEPTHPGGSLAPRPALGRLLAFVTSNCTLPLMQWGPHEVLYASCTWAPAGRGGGGEGGPGVCSMTGQCVNLDTFEAESVVEQLWSACACVHVSLHEWSVLVQACTQAALSTPVELLLPASSAAAEIQIDNFKRNNTNHAC